MSVPDNAGSPVLLHFGVPVLYRQFPTCSATLTWILSPANHRVPSGYSLFLVGTRSCVLVGNAPTRRAAEKVRGCDDWFVFAPRFFGDGSCDLCGVHHLFQRRVVAGLAGEV